MINDSCSQNRRGVFALTVVVIIVVSILLLMVTDIIPWRIGPLTKIYNYDSYKIFSLYVYNRQDGEILFSTDENDLKKICDTLIDLDWHPVWLSRSAGGALVDAVQVYVVYQNDNGDEKRLLIYCTGDETISVHALDVPNYRRADIDYQVSGGYDLSWIYKSDR